MEISPLTTAPGQDEHAATDLVVALADCVKLSAMYPRANARVHRACNGTLDAAIALRGTRSQVRLRVVDGVFRIGRIRVDVAKGNVKWLLAAMEKTAVGALELESTLSIDGLLDFAEELRKNAASSQNARTFEEMWTTTFDGISVHERVFMLSAHLASMDGLSEATKSVLQEQSTRGERIREMLDDESVVGAHLSRYSGQAGGQESADGIGTAIDVLCRVLDVLPGEILEDPTACMEFVERLLSTSDEILYEAGVFSEPEEVLAESRRRVLDVSIRYFVRPDGRGDVDALPGAAPRPAGGGHFGNGHFGDEQFQEDLELFLREYAELPDPKVKLAATRDLVEAPREKLVMALEVLCRALHRGDDGAALAAGPPLAAAVQLCNGYEDAEAPRIVARYLDRLEGVAVSPGFVQVLDDAGLLVGALDRGRVTDEAIAGAFPIGFGTFVDWASGQARGAERLDTVLGLVGTERVYQSKLKLVGRGRPLGRERFEKIYASASPHAVVFALMQLDHDDQSPLLPVIELLGRLRLTGRESAGLRYVEPRQLPWDYVIRLCRFVLGDESEASVLQQRSEKMVRTYIENAGPDDDEARVVRAIAAMREFWSPRTEEFVRELAGGGLLGLGRRPKAIRAAAKMALKSVRGRR